MEFKDMSKKEIIEMIRTEIKTLGNFLDRVDEETGYNIQAFAKIAMFDEEELDFNVGSLHFGDPHVIKTIVKNDIWIKDKREEELNRLLDAIFNVDMEDDDDEA